MRPRFCGITGWPLCDASQARQRCKAGRVRSCRAPPVAIRMRRILIPPGRCPPCPVKNETRRPCARSAGFNWLQPMSPSASVFLSLTAHTGLREHEHSKSQARAPCKPYFSSRKTFVARASTSSRRNTAPPSNVAQVEIIWSATRARSSFAHARHVAGFLDGLLIRENVLPCAIAERSQAAQRASRHDTSSPACPARQSRRALRSRTG